MSNRHGRLTDRERSGFKIADFHVRLGVRVEFRPNDSWAMSHGAPGQSARITQKALQVFFMIKKYLILTFSLLGFLKCNENRKFLLSFFVFIKLKMGNTLDFISMIY